MVGFSILAVFVYVCISGLTYMFVTSRNWAMTFWPPRYYEKWSEAYADRKSCSVESRSYPDYRRAERTNAVNFVKACRDTAAFVLWPVGWPVMIVFYVFVVAKSILKFISVVPALFDSIKGE